MATDAQRAALADSVVPKALRARVLFLIKDMPRGEARAHAYAWARGARRTRTELERFVERMTS